MFRLVPKCGWCLWDIEETYYQCHIQSYFEAGILVCDPKLKPQNAQKCWFWCKLLSMFLVAEPREWCFELFRMQNSQKFPGFCPWTPLGRACGTAPDSPAAQWFFSLLRSLKNRHPQKTAGYGTDYPVPLVIIFHIWSFWDVFLIIFQFIENGNSSEHLHYLLSLFIWSGCSHSGS